MKILVIMNHDLTEEQRKSIKGEIVQIRPVNIPVSQGRDEIVGRIMKEVEYTRPDIIICQTDYEVFAKVLLYCCQTKTPLFGSLTERQVREITLPDGTVKKESTFKFSGWRRFFPLPSITKAILKEEKNENS